MNPPSIARPASAAPSPSVTGARPTATSSFSTTSDSRRPPASSISIATPAGVVAAPITFVAVRISDAALLERLFQLLGNGLVLIWHDAGKQLDQRDFTSEPAKDRRELDSHSAAPEDGQRLRNPGKIDRIVARHDLLPVDDDPRRVPRRGPRGHDDLARLQLPGLGTRDIDAALTTEPRGAFHPLDLVLLEKELDAFREAGHDLVLARVHARHVDPGLDASAPKTDAPFGRVLRHLQSVRVLEQGFCRDTAPIEAGAPKRGLPFHDCGPKAELRRADGSHVTARARADHDDVVLVSQLGLRLCFFRRLFRIGDGLPVDLCDARTKPCEVIAQLPIGLAETRELAMKDGCAKERRSRGDCAHYGEKKDRQHKSRTLTDGPNGVKSRYDGYGRVRGTWFSANLLE